MKRYLLPIVALCLILGLSSIKAQDADDQQAAEDLARVLELETARIKAVEQVYPSVVAVFGMNAGAGGGSGVLLDEAGYAVTNFHVVRPAGVKGKAGLADGKLYDWDLIGIDPGGDLAIIKLKGKSKFPVSAMGESDDVEVGEFAMAMGNPFVLAEDYKPTVTMGIVSGVRRFQKGMKNNLLVYGNCIQIDPSINPGNSGGPLYNMQGQVIGINGRGSFEERGRVNVGVGYAISMEQVRNFYMGMMATQTTRHGTLEATFRFTGNKVICDQINLDSPIAKAGMELGDRLISFNGEPIETANEYTNIIWTLPEAWPVHVVWENFEGRRESAWVRLTHLDYGPQREEKPKPKPKKVPSTQPKKFIPIDGENIKKALGPKPIVGKPGQIGSKKVNQSHARRLIKRWQKLAFGKVSRNLKAFKRVEQVISNDAFPAILGEREVIESIDGRYLVKVTKAYGAFAEGDMFGFDGKNSWVISKKAQVSDIDYTPAQQKLMMNLLMDGQLKSVKDYVIENGDLVAERRAYRMKFKDKENEETFVWISLLDEGLEYFQARPLKMSADRDGDANASIVYDQYHRVEGMYLPMKRHVVKGLGDAKQISFGTTELKILLELDDATFKKPEDQS